MPSRTGNFIPRDRAFALNVPTFAYLFVCLLIAPFSEAMRRALRRARRARSAVSTLESINDGFVAIDSDGRELTRRIARPRSTALGSARPGSARMRDAVFPLSIGVLSRPRLRKAAGDAVAVEFEHRDGGAGGSRSRAHPPRVAVWRSTFATSPSASWPNSRWPKARNACACEQGAKAGLFRQRPGDRPEHVVLGVL